MTRPISGPLPTFEAFTASEAYGFHPALPHLRDAKKGTSGTRTAHFLRKFASPMDKHMAEQEVARMNKDCREEDRHGHDEFELVGCQMKGWHVAKDGKRTELDWFLAKCNCGSVNTYNGGWSDFEMCCPECGYQNEVQDYSRNHRDARGNVHIKNG